MIIGLQFFGGRGGGSDGGNLLGRSVAQDRALKRIAKRTANLKNEQSRIVDRNGDILVEKRGDRHSVGMTVGEKRDNLKGNAIIHNHPEGGTFSSDDLRDFGYGATEITVATPEGTYRMVNKRVGKSDQYDGWYNMQQAVRQIDEREQNVSIATRRNQARQNTANSQTQREIDSIEQRYNQIRQTSGAQEANNYARQTAGRYATLSSQRTAEIDAEVRRLETQPYHDFYRQNASSYGFDYRFNRN